MDHQTLTSEERADQLLQSLLKKTGLTNVDTSIVQDLRMDILSAFSKQDALTREACSNALTQVYNENEYCPTDIVWIELENAQKACLGEQFRPNQTR